LAERFGRSRQGRKIDFRSSMNCRWVKIRWKHFIQTIASKIQIQLHTKTSL
jgi:hypothetical protein